MFVEKNTVKFEPLTLSFFFFPLSHFVHIHRSDFWPSLFKRVQLDSQTRGRDPVWGDLIYRQGHERLPHLSPFVILQINITNITMKTVTFGVYSEEALWVFLIRSSYTEMKRVHVIFHSKDTLYHGRSSGIMVMSLLLSRNCLGFNTNQTKITMKISRRNHRAMAWTQRRFTWGLICLGTPGVIFWVWSQGFYSWTFHLTL